MPEEATRQLGLGILQRVAMREMARLQSHFLSELNRLPLGEQLVFRGGAALHGVYLGGRWSKDLDFFAPPEIAFGIRAIAAEQGLLLEEPPKVIEEGYTLRGHKRDPTARPDGTLSVFALPGTVHSRVEIRVDVCSRDNTLFPVERQMFVPLSYPPVSVRVQRLSELMADKFGCVLRRSKAMDFLDLWYGLNARPDLKDEIRDVMERKDCGPYDIVPLQTFTTEAALAHLENTEETWDEKTSTALSTPPSFDRVREDLTVWLPFFNMTEQ